MVPNKLERIHRFCRAWDWKSSCRQNSRLCFLYCTRMHSIQNYWIVVNDSLYRPTRCNRDDDDDDEKVWENNKKLASSDNLPVVLATALTWIPFSATAVVTATDGSNVEATIIIQYFIDTMVCANCCCYVVVLVFVVVVKREREREYECACDFFFGNFPCTIFFEWVVSTRRRSLIVPFGLFPISHWILERWLLSP